MINFFIGLIGLGLVVFVHEAGHFISAKLSGIEVEAFSIGWGKILYAFQYKGTEYRISALPLGGYCKLKGEESLKKAIEENSNDLNKEKGSFFSASPIKRIIVSFCGPLFNLIFSIIVLSLIWYFGFNIKTFDNKIIALNHLTQNNRESLYPAESGGLKTGDTIIQINNKKINHYKDIQEAIVISNTKQFNIKVKRNTETISLKIEAEKNKETGTNFIGISPWVTPVLGEIKKDSSAFIAGLKENDLLLKINNNDITNNVDFYNIMASNPEILNIKYKRAEKIHTTKLIINYMDGYANTGFYFKPIIYKSPKLSFISSMKNGFTETFDILNSSIKGLGLLFKGTSFKKNVSGPIRITYYVGEIAADGFKSSIQDGFTNLFRFLCLLSVALFFMNMLPIPPLDGGQIVFNLAEILYKKSFKPKTLYRFQLFGLFFILILVVFTTFNDISFLFTK